MGLLDSIYGGIVGITQLNKAGQINPQFTQYTASPYAQTNVANAQQAFNGRMAGGAALDQNILANQANTLSNTAKTATSGSQALAVNAGTQGQTNKAFSQEQIQEAQNHYQMLNNLNYANQGMVQEGDKAYQSMLQKYQMDTQQQNALRSAGLTNIGNALGGASSTAAMGGSGGGGGGGGILGMAGGLLSMIL